MRRKPLFSVFGIIALILAFISVPVYFLYEYATYKFACSRLEDVDFWNSASPDEMRRTAHKILNYTQSGHHDAYIVLIRCGNMDSVPYLIRALKYEMYTKEGVFMDCQKGHCLEALEKITGKKLGQNYSDWEVLLDK